MHKDLNRTIKQNCKERREDWLRGKCEESEQLERVDARLMAYKSRQVTEKKRPTRSTIIKDANGTLLTDRSEVLKRWQDYVGELYSDDDRGIKEIENPVVETTVLRSEEEQTIRKMRL